MIPTKEIIKLGQCQMFAEVASLGISKGLLNPAQWYLSYKAQLDSFPLNESIRASQASASLDRCFADWWRRSNSIFAMPDKATRYQLMTDAEVIADLLARYEVQP